MVHPRISLGSLRLPKALLGAERAVKFLLLQSEARTDHDGASSGEVLDELRNEGSPGAPGVSSQREEQLESRHSVRIALDCPDFATLLLGLEVYVESATSVDRQHFLEPNIFGIFEEFYCFGDRNDKPLES